MDVKTKCVEWGAFLSAIRNYFYSQSFLEVTTAHLVRAGAFESVIDPLIVSYSAGRAELHSSPEIEMKKIFSEIKTNIFQICQCWRDDPLTDTHLREFTMLEFYRVNATYEEAQNDMVQLLRWLFGEKLPPIERMSVREAGLKFAGVDLLDLKVDDDDLFFKILIEKIEPNLPFDRPTILYDYPASQSALGKVNAPQKITERFEIYWKGMEICNGCTELTDKEEALRRYERESNLRIQSGKKPHPYPKSLFEAFELGIPPSAGVAVGLNRLFRCPRIREPN